jgi:pyridinium-3,5-biscarboxylic acid mononucleotide synthase
MSILKCSLVEVYISVGQQADEHLELLEQLLHQEAFRRDNGMEEQANEQEYGLLSSSVLQQKLQHSEHNDISSVVETRPDATRERRKGVPEVIFGETKNVEQILAIARVLLAESGRAIISRARPEAVEALRETFPGYPLRVRASARAVVIYRPDYIPRSTGGLVGIISAGTSDIPVADEAALIAEEMGCSVTCIYDVGVAGLHRLLEPLRNLLSTGVDVIVVAAGMDGALPSVVAGLVPVPVIGLPTSIGYGMGGKGFAALLSMLQTCAPGLTVVNIDNGIGAGSTAALIANRVAQARGHQSQ